MSQLLGNASPQFIITMDDNRHLANAYSADQEVILGPLFVGDFRNPWWPRSGFFGDTSTDIGVLDATSLGFETPEVTHGSDGRLMISGYTRDAYGSPIGGCTVKLFRTFDDSLQSVAVSDPNTGFYQLTTPFYPDTHYVMAYKAAVPDIAGATVNTLIGS
jgi:hypothetical protein